MKAGPSRHSFGRRQAWVLLPLCLLLTKWAKGSNPTCSTAPSQIQPTWRGTQQSEQRASTFPMRTLWRVQTASRWWVVEKAVWFPWVQSGSRKTAPRTATSMSRNVSSTKSLMISSKTVGRSNNNWGLRTRIKTLWDLGGHLQKASLSTGLTQISLEMRWGNRQHMRRFCRARKRTMGQPCV